jgi:hypothetical protein
MNIFGPQKIIITESNYILISCEGDVSMVKEIVGPC